VAPTFAGCVDAGRPIKRARADALQIFREWLGLSVWRDRVLGHVEDLAQRALKQQARDQRRVRGEAASSPDDTGVLALRVHESQVATLKDHFRDIYVLGDAIFDSVLAIAADAVALAQSSPHDIVCAAEVCERADLHAAKERALRGLTSTPVRREAFLRALGHAADERAKAALDREPLRLDACAQLLADLVAVHEHLAKCLPASYAPLRLVRKWYEARLVRAVAQALQASAHDVERTLAVLAWAQQYNAAMGAMQDRHVGLDRVVEEAVDVLVASRLDPACAAAAVTAPAAIVQLEDGKLVTRIPEALRDVFARFLGQCCAALSGAPLFKVLAACLGHAADWRARVANEFAAQTPPTPERLGAHVNDCERLGDWLAELFVDVARALDSPAVLAQATELMDRVSAGLSGDCEGAVARIVQGGIVRDVVEHIAPSLFAPEWETSSDVPFARLVATLEDWFDHPEAGLARWLQGRVFIGMALDAAYRQVVLCVLDALLAWPCRFGNVPRAAGRLREDARMLNAFYSRRRRRAVAYAAPDDELWLALLDSVADVLAEGGGDDAAEAIDVLGRAFGSHGLPVVLDRLRLLGARTGGGAGLGGGETTAPPEGYGFCHMHFGWAQGLPSELRAFGDVPAERDVVEVSLPPLGKAAVVVVERETLLGRLVKQAAAATSRGAKRA